MTDAAVAPFYADEFVTLWQGDSIRNRFAWLDADVLITDPPYGIAFASGMGGAFGSSEIVNDDSTATRDAALRAWGSKPSLVFGSWRQTKPPDTHTVLTWEKGNHVGMGDLSIPWKPNTEEIYVCGRGFVGHRGSSVLRHLAIAGTVGQARLGTRHHPTEKPLALIETLILACPDEWVIADPFAGSCTTLVAAKRLGRRAIGVEIDPAYCAAGVSRLGQGVLGLAA